MDFPHGIEVGFNQWDTTQWRISYVLSEWTFIAALSPTTVVGAIPTSQPTLRTVLRIFPPFVRRGHLPLSPFLPRYFSCPRCSVPRSPTPSPPQSLFTATTSLYLLASHPAPRSLLPHHLTPRVLELSPSFSVVSAHNNSEKKLAKRDLAPANWCTQVSAGSVSDRFSHSFCYGRVAEVVAE